jgi:DNA modification methylase
MNEPVIIGDAVLYLGDCREILPTLGRVDAVVTSPPYAQQRDYGKPIDDWRSLVSGAMLAANYAADAQILVNLGLIYRDGECVEYWDDLNADMRAAGWRVFGWYVWDKGFGAPGDWNGRCAPAHEFVFHFNKSARPLNKWIKTQKIKRQGTGLRKANGEMSGICSPDKYGQPFKIPDSVIRTPPHQARGGIESKHPAVYPVNFAKHLVLTFSGDGHTILDPFMGSGTTGVACAKLGRKFIGIEIEERYFTIACKRIEEAYRQADLFIKRDEPAPKPVQEALI